VNDFIKPIILILITIKNNFEMGCISGSATVGVERPVLDSMQMKSISESSKEDKMKQIDEFIDKSLNVSTSDFSNQQELLKLIN
jgi:hypothetical protein